MNNNITITVSGKVNTGKSTVAAAILKMLNENGITNVTLNDDFTDNRKNHDLANIKDKLNVNITTINVIQEPLQND